MSTASSSRSAFMSRQSLNVCQTVAFPIPRCCRNSFPSPISPSLSVKLGKSLFVQNGHLALTLSHNLGITKMTFAFCFSVKRGLRFGSGELACVPERTTVFQIGAWFYDCVLQDLWRDRAYVLYICIVADICVLSNLGIRYGYVVNCC